jgi:hypothetical protein
MKPPGHSLAETPVTHLVPRWSSSRSRGTGVSMHACVPAADGRDPHLPPALQAPLVTIGAIFRSLLVASITAGMAGCGSTNSGSASGAPAAGPSRAIAVACAWGDVRASGDAPDCECKSSGGDGDRFSYSGANCSADTTQIDSAPLYCADPDYPRSGSCSYWSGGPWRCSGGGSSCDCSFDSFHIPESILTWECNAQPDSDGTPWHCCLKGADCFCSKGNTACGDQYREVQDCSSNLALGLKAPPVSCPDGQMEVQTCRVIDKTEPPTGGCRGSFDCPGECSGSGSFVCCPICGSDGICTTSCCSPSGCY